MDKLKRIGGTILDYSECANADSECPSDCNFHGCMMYRPKEYKA
jgi:hypothetical protein